ncbi:MULTISPECIES: helix-turn-helix domain-containing protein [Anoxybacillaceae]|uniref:Uncharacterized protein n=1 Tax=Parageobacillus galactosidasius TaxID=883812 RepID=A0A226QKH2_9BACL|nr:hypothetical protein B9L23_11225 [Parageobacillus galactosidasius]
MIRELYQKGWTQTAIAKETGFDRKTIRKYLKGDKLPERKVSEKKRKSKLDPYKSYLLQRIQGGTTNCVVFLDEIQALNVYGKGKKSGFFRSILLFDPLILDTSYLILGYS